ncbi:MAG: hypothetical protein EB004_03275 [Actinobacteria bacterium]|nr:hypothetical protein [Actinomycetota bacterium]
MSAFTLRALEELSLATGDMTGKYPMSSKSLMIFGFTFLIFPTRPNLASSLSSTSNNLLSLPVIPTAGSPAAIKSLTTERSTLPVRTNSTTPLNIDVDLNGVRVCRSSSPGEDRSKVVMTGELIEILIDLKVGSSSATIWTNDLTASYVHENSAYST